MIWSLFLSIFLWTTCNATDPTRHKRSMPSAEVKYWSLPVPYTWNLDYPVYDELAVYDALSFWTNETCVRFRFAAPGSEPFMLKIGSYGVGGCQSFNGKQDFQPQEIALDPSCSVKREIAYSLGKMIEHGRPDRDQYVRFIADNCCALRQSAEFFKSPYVDSNGFSVGYDYGSCMHHSRKDYSKNGGDTLVTLDPNFQMTIGQTDPSFADVKKMNRAYCGSICDNSPITCRNGGYPNPNNCAVCKCPPAFAGTLCGGVTTGTGTCGTRALTATTVSQTVAASGPGTCYYVISSPADTQIGFQLTNLTITSSFEDTCKGNFLEINYLRDFALTGARFCNSTYPTISRSQSNKLVLTYKGHANARFSLNYWYY